MRTKLYTSGPVEVPAHIQQALTFPVKYHRDPDFLDIFYHVLDGMKYLFQTKHEVLPFTTSGTGGMEASVVNLFSPGDTVLVVEQGKFSERWTEICETYKLNVEKIVLPWRNSIDLTQIERTVKNIPKLSGVFLNHCETSTGALNDIHGAAEIIHANSDAMLIVDAISTLGVVPFTMDDWGIDVAITASNKGLMNPPGLVFIAMNERVWQRTAHSQLNKYYFDFVRARQAVAKGTGSAFTPAISLFYGVNEAITTIKRIGLDEKWAQHRKLARSFRKAISAIDLKVWPAKPADSLTVFEIPIEQKANQIADELRDKYQVVISKGQGMLKDRILRVGHLSEIVIDDYATILTGIENIIQRLRYQTVDNISRHSFLENYR